MPSYWSRFTNTIAYVLLSNRSYNFRSHAIIFLQSKLSYRLYRTNAISNAFYKNCHSYYKCVYSSSLVTLCQYLTRFTDFINKYLVNLLRFTLFNVTQYMCASVPQYMFTFLFDINLFNCHMHVLSFKLCNRTYSLYLFLYFITKLCLFTYMQVYFYNKIATRSFVLRSGKGI